MARRIRLCLMLDRHLGGVQPIANPGYAAVVARSASALGLWLRFLESPGFLSCGSLNCARETCLERSRRTDESMGKSEWVWLGLAALGWAGFDLD